MEGRIILLGTLLLHDLGHADDNLLGDPLDGGDGLLAVLQHLRDPVQTGNNDVVLTLLLNHLTQLRDEVGCPLLESFHTIS